MSKVRNFAEIIPNLPFSEFIFYELYRETFGHSELGRMKNLLPLHEMAESLGLVDKSMMPKRGRKSYFTPEGKVALMFLKMKTQMSFPKLMEELNGNIHYQLFCDILIDPTHPLTNYKLLDGIAAELAGETRERLCETGTCASSRHGDGGDLRDAGGALLLASDQGQKEGDGDLAHLLRHPHREIRAMKPGPSEKMI